jgi:hypothetical protein
LSNSIYLGRIAHKGQLYDGRHDALIDQQTWDAVQARLTGNGHDRHRAATVREPSLLSGLLFDADGERLSPSHAVKSGRRYRYYISRALISEAGSDHGRGWRLPAHDIEQAVISALVRTDALGPMLELPRPRRRWTVPRKAAVVAAVRGGWLPDRGRMPGLQTLGR